MSAMLWIYTLSEPAALSSVYRDVEWPQRQRGIVPTGGIDRLAEFEKPR